MSEKLILSRWQWDEITDVLIRSVPMHIQLWMDERFTIRTTPKGAADVPVLYIFFGYKQELTRWRLEHGIAAKDTFLARDYAQMQGLRARPVPVYDWGWMSNNIRHNIVLQAREEIYQLEARYGSGPELYRSYA